MTFLKKKVEELPRLTPEEFKQAPKLPVSILLHNIRSAMNVGSIFRTADAFRIEKIFLSGYTAIPPSPEIRKTALGATKSVAWEKVESPVSFLHSVKQKNIRIIAVEQTHNSLNFTDFSWNKEPVLLLFGNEVKGVEQEHLNLSDLALEIPQYGTKHSLNISVCAGIVLYKFFEWSL